MSSKVGPIGEGSTTLSTGKWLFTRVGPHVTLEQPGPRKCLTAQVAFTRKCVSSNVHLEGTE